MHAEAFLTARTAHRVIPAAYRQPENGFAVPAFPVPTDFAISNTVAGQLEKAFDFGKDTEKFSILFAALVNVLGKVAKKRPDQKGIRRNQQNSRMYKCVDETES